MVKKMDKKEIESKIDYKNLTIRKKVILGVFATALLFVGFVAAPVGAQASNANAAQGVQISPTLVELNASKGKTYNNAGIGLLASGGALLITGTVLIFITKDKPMVSVYSDGHGVMLSYSMDF